MSVKNVGVAQTKIADEARQNVTRWAAVRLNPCSRARPKHERKSDHGQDDRRHLKRYERVASDNATEDASPHGLERAVRGKPLVQPVFASVKEFPGGLGIGPVIADRALAKRVGGEDCAEKHENDNPQPKKAG